MLVDTPPASAGPTASALPVLSALSLADGDAAARPVGRGSRAPLDRPGADGLYYRAFRSEAEDLPSIVRLCEEELSEPYNAYTFRYFLVEWPHLAFLVFPSPTSARAIATIVCKQETHRNRTSRGYIGMLSVDRGWRRRGIARRLVELAVDEMVAHGANEVALETEYNNAPSLALYGSLGFLREKRLYRFYSNGNDAFRLIRPLRDGGSDAARCAETNGDDDGRYFMTELAAAVLAGPTDGGMPSLTHERVETRPAPRVPPRPERPSYIM